MKEERRKEERYRREEVVQDDVVKYGIFHPLGLHGFDHSP